MVQRHRERRTHKKRTPIWLNVWVGRWRDGPSLETIGLVEGAPRTTAGSISSGGWSTGHFRDIPGYIWILFWGWWAIIKLFRAVVRLQ